MRFRLLGPVGFEASAGPIKALRPRQRAILGFLLLHCNQFVSTDSLETALWGPHGPATARNQVQSDISVVRRLIQSASGVDPIHTRSPGYLLQLRTHELDLSEFTALQQVARAASDPEQAARSLRAALELWRGPALADINAAYAEGHRAHLEEQHLYTYEQLMDLELRLGRHADVIAELMDLVGQHALRERLVCQLMLALHRAGRSVDALQQARRLRTALVEQHGMDPGPALQALEHDILRRDPRLDPPRTLAAASARSAVS